MGEDSDPIDGYDVFLGGGFSDSQAIAKEFMKNVDAELIPQLIANILEVYMRHRTDESEPFFEFAARNTCETLLELLQHKEEVKIAS